MNGVVDNAECVSDWDVSVSINEYFQMACVFSSAFGFSAHEKGG